MSFQRNPKQKTQIHRGQNHCTERQRGQAVLKAHTQHPQMFITGATLTLFQSSLQVTRS